MKSQEQEKLEWQEVPYRAIFRNNFFHSTVTDGEELHKFFLHTLSFSKDYMSIDNQNNLFEQ